MWETWVGKIPWRRKRLPTLVFWPGKSMDCTVHRPPGQVIMAIDKEPGQLFELAGLKVTAKIRCRGQSQGHHSHLDSCTDLGKTASAPSSQGQCLSSTFGGLAGGPLWLLCQRWVFHLQLDSEQIPTTRNQEQSEGRKACISSPLIPSLSVCHKSTLF